MQYTRPLIEYLKGVSDYRSSRKKKHDLAEMLMCLVFGFLAGKTTISRALKWCKDNLHFLQGFMNLKNGIASKATISRMLMHVDQSCLSYIFMLWAADLVDLSGRTAILDGQGLIAGTKRIEDGKAPYILNVLDMETQLVTGQMPIDEKSNEITALPIILSQMKLYNTTVMIDAIGTQTAIMKLIIEQGGHFLLTVKRNNPKMYEEILSYFTAAREAEDKRTSGKEISSSEKEMLGHCELIGWKTEKNRERNEHRRCGVSDQVEYVSRVNDDLPFIKCIARHDSVRIMRKTDENGKDITPDRMEMIQQYESSDDMQSPVQSIGLISDRRLSAEEIVVLKRKEWKIENGLHHVLHESFREDRCPAKAGKNNLALIRKIAYNLIRIALIRGDVKDTGSFMEAMDSFNSAVSMHRLYQKYLFSGIEAFN